jgi:hypothetical protein
VTGSVHFSEIRYLIKSHRDFLTDKIDMGRAMQLLHASGDEIDEAVKAASAALDDYYNEVGKARWEALEWLIRALRANKQPNR